MSGRERITHAVLTVVGALAGMLWVWLQRTQPPEPEQAGRFLLIEPTYVIPVPWWAYAAVGVIGGLTALFLSLVIGAAREGARTLRTTDNR